MEIDRRRMVASLAATALLPGSGVAAGSAEVTAGLATTPMLDQDRVAFRVIGIDWFSGFRASELRIGDQIVSVDGKAFSLPATQRETQQFVWAQIGQGGETQRWEQLRKVPGSRVTLGLRRRDTPGQGWRLLQATGTLEPRDNSRDAQGRPILGPGGPGAMFPDDGFGSAWSSFADDLAKSASALLDDPLFALSRTTRFELEQHLARQKRVSFLAERYPGPFARAVQQDFEAILARLHGPEIGLPEGALAYRNRNEERAEEIRGLARQAWAALLAELAPDTIVPPFPAVHPVHGDRASVIGRYVVLPPLRNRDWVGEAGRTWFVAGGRDLGWYFADAEGPEAVRMLDALARFRRLVMPNPDETWQIIGQVQPEPGQLVVGDRAWFGLRVKPVAALVGEAMFVDLRRPEGRVSRFAGEERLRQRSAALPPDSAGPAEVLRAMVVALKEGDLRLWQSLFATWGIEWLGDGRPLFRANAQEQPERYFEEARRRILDRVVDMRPVWVDDARALIPGDRYPGQQRLEEVTVEMQHVGPAPGGGYWAFSDVSVHRWWKLQRLGDGPWRISSLQAI